MPGFSCLLRDTICLPRYVNNPGRNLLMTKQISKLQIFTPLIISPIQIRPLALIMPTISLIPYPSLFIGTVSVLLKKSLRTYRAICWEEGVGEALSRQRRQEPLRERGK